ncbi:MAG: CPBP family glutamic-type intramembrane protease [Cyanobacteriota bacterium]|nr:CPBP family glutamic-type intramembrane protease [Cyanobacteriota bacterium]
MKRLSTGLALLALVLLLLAWPGAGQAMEPGPATDVYRPHADWIGRLILPSASEQAARPGDWVWVELEQGPAAAGVLPGRRYRLHWSNRPRLQALVASVTTPVRLGEVARRSAAAGNVVPTRLDGRRVGPLQSLAGARPNDDVIVSLEGVRADGGDGLRIDRPPVQITGRWMGLVTVLGPVDPQGQADLYRVRHYEPANGLFTGRDDTIRLPRSPADRSGRRSFDPQGIADSAANPEGWFIYGAPASDGVFTVEAIEPRALTRLTAWQAVQGLQPGRHWLRHNAWGDPPGDRGSINKVSLQAKGGRPWQRGDRALLIHGFGGIGGSGGEPVRGFTVTGHFAFGEARVVADPFTGEDRWVIRYHQIYANNPNGIIAGTHDWTSYTGNLQRGWLGTRPIVDVAVKVGQGPFSQALLDELGLQAEVISARYRSGDGAGVADVTPATSCVQDSGQALWITIDQMRRQPALTGLEPKQQHRLERLARSLHDQITPFGIVRPDWRHNAAVVAGAIAAADRGESPTIGAFQASQGPAAVLLSWRSMLPRRAHDDLSQAFLSQGLPLWVLRTSLIPGTDPTLDPMAPTRLLGEIGWLSLLLARLSDGLSTAGWARNLPLALVLLAIEAAVALPLAARNGLVNLAPPRRLQPGWGRRALGYLLMPALVEELIFRAALLPQADEGLGVGATVGWLGFSVAAFVVYHPLAGRLWYPPGRRLFHRPVFLAQCALLGLICGLGYLVTGSVWPGVVIHWATVVVWLEWLGGRSLLVRRPAPPGGTIR